MRVLFLDEFVVESEVLIGWQTLPQLIHQPGDWTERGHGPGAAAGGVPWTGGGAGWREGRRYSGAHWCESLED